MQRREVRSQLGTPAVLILDSQVGAQRRAPRKSCPAAQPGAAAARTPVERESGGYGESAAEERSPAQSHIKRCVGIERGRYEVKTPDAVGIGPGAQDLREARLSVHADLQNGRDVAHVELTYDLQLRSAPHPSCDLCGRVPQDLTGYVRKLALAARRSNRAAGAPGALAPRAGDQAAAERVR